ncbi:MAG: isoaspartyl peptidase/L-asparaginase, partial [Halobacteriaceae archaeon]
DCGIETGVNLTTESTRSRWDGIEPPTGGPLDHVSWLRDRFGGADTVGAVARQGDRLACGTSTGGRWLALAGRVGDVPQIGAGFYASPAAAASATGAGEDIARVTLTRRTVRHVERGLSAEEAARTAIDEFGELTDGSAGVIVIDSGGRVGQAFNSEAMQTATAREN